jgi:hypothetical protein
MVTGFGDVLNPMSGEKDLPDELSERVRRQKKNHLVRRQGDLFCSFFGTKRISLGPLFGD